jgi:hypothetical protein
VLLYIFFLLILIKKSVGETKLIPSIILIILQAFCASSWEPLQAYTTKLDFNNVKI